MRQSQGPFIALRISFGLIAAMALAMLSVFMLGAGICLGFAAIPGALAAKAMGSVITDTSGFFVAMAVTTLLFAPIGVLVFWRVKIPPGNCWKCARRLTPLPFVHCTKCGIPCDACGYDLRYNSGGSCPECGAQIGEIGKARLFDKTTDSKG